MDINVYLEKVTKLPTPHKMGILGGVVILILVGYYFFGYINQQNELTKQSAALSKLKSELTEKKAIADNLSKFQEEVNKLQNKLKEALSKLPNNSEIDQLLVDIPNLGKESGLSVVDFVPGRESSKGFYAEVPIKLKLRGSYFDIATFLFKLSDLSRIVNMKDIKLTPDSVVGKVDAGNEDAKDKKEFPLTVEGMAITYRFVEKKPEPEEAKK